MKPNSEHGPNGQSGGTTTSRSRLVPQTPNPTPQTPVVPLSPPPDSCSARSGSRSATARRRPSVGVWALVGDRAPGRGASGGVCYAIVARILRYLRDVPDLGPLLAGKLLGMILIGFFGILLLSNVITALSTFFLARDLDLLVGQPGAMAGALHGKVDRDTRELQLDGGAHGGPDHCRVRDRLSGRPMVSTHRDRRVRTLLLACRRWAAPSR